MAVEGFEWVLVPHKSFSCNWEGYGIFLGTLKSRMSPKGCAEEWVPIAEALAAEHGGVLPNRRWLTKNGYMGLDAAMKRRPELFARIPQAVINNKTKQPQVRLDGEITSIQREVA